MLQFAPSTIGGPGGQTRKQTVKHTVHGKTLHSCPAAAHGGGKPDRACPGALSGAQTREGRQA